MDQSAPSLSFTPPPLVQVTCSVPFELISSDESQNQIEVPLSIPLSDNCDILPDAVAIVTRENSPNPFWYNETRTWNFQDQCGNTDSYTTKIIVADIEAPVLTCHDVVLKTDGSLIEDVPDIDIGIEDCDPNPTIEQTPLGSVTPAQTVSITISDRCIWKFKILQFFCYQ
jgi:hypothetical protein